MLRLLTAMGVLMLLLALGACGDKSEPVEAGVSRQLAEARAGLLSNINYRLRFDIPEDVDLVSSTPCLFRTAPALRFPCLTSLT